MNGKLYCSKDETFADVRSAEDKKLHIWPVEAKRLEQNCDNNRNRSRKEES